VPNAQAAASEPIDEQYRILMNAICHHLDHAFNGDAKGAARQVGFVLLVFPFGDEEIKVNYISNGCDREEIAKALRKVATRFEPQEEWPGQMAPVSR